MQLTLRRKWWMICLLLKTRIKKKTLKQLKFLIWKATSRIVRLSSRFCYTCDRGLPYEERCTGHFWAKGGHGYVRFDMRNLRVQCVSCNSFKSGNLAEYAVRLREEIGDKEFNDLSLDAHSSKRHPRCELEDMLVEREKMREEAEANFAG